MAQYARPTDLSEALALLASVRWTILAGATDHYPARVERPRSEDILDISGVQGLAEIEQDDDYWRIGAGVTWTEIAEAELPATFDGLRRAARAIGGRSGPRTLLPRAGCTLRRCGGCRRTPLTDMPGIFPPIFSGCFPLFSLNIYPVSPNIPNLSP